MDSPSVAQVQIRKISPGLSIELEDSLAIEEPLEIQVQYKSGGALQTRNISVTMRTPGNDRELAAGFLFTENIFSGNHQLLDIISTAQNKVTVILKDECVPVLNNTERNFYTTSSCGVCGKSGVDAIKTVSSFTNVADNIFITSSLIYRLPHLLKQQQEVFNSTGGLHASALFAIDGKFLSLREDVGRHNALDKLIGYYLLSDELPLNNSILLLSGRASFELVQKANMAGIKFIAAVGAPSSLAVQLAGEMGITLAGFLRDKRFNIYSGEHRINHNQ